MSSNLPPGVTDSMIPGNRPEDDEWDNAVDVLLEDLCKAGIEPKELKVVARIGIAAVLHLREVEKEILKNLQFKFIG